MKGLVKYAKGRDGLEIRDLTKPTPEEDQILVKVMAAGICGTDLHILKDEYNYDPPVVLGHEFTGTIEEIGNKVEGFQPGDQIVSMTAVVSCGKCQYCRQGLNMLCDQRLSIGSGINGAMAEYIIVPAIYAYKLPSTVTGSDMMALAEPLACVIRSVTEQSTVKAGDVVLVSGPGTIGQLTMLIAKLQGAFVILSGIAQDSERLKLGADLGADVTVSNHEDLQKATAHHAPEGVDVAFECAGAVSSLDTCIDELKKTGILSQVGLYGRKIPLDMDKILMKELKLTVSYATERTSWEILMKLSSQGKLSKVGRLISARVPLHEWKRGFEMAENQEGYKIVLVP